MKKIENVKEIRDSKGITLVALVVTIIVLLILAAVSLNLVAGENGILSRAEKAANLTKEKQIEEDERLNEYVDLIDKYVNDKNEIVKGTTVADAISKNDILSNINDTELSDEYGNKIVIPSGFKVLSDASTVDKGIVIEDITNKNQFVWVPVGKIYTDSSKTEEKSKTINLSRYIFTDDGTTYEAKGSEEIEGKSLRYKEISSSEYNEITSPKDINGFISSVNEYSGYYIGRYEARKNSSGNLTTVKSDSVWKSITPKEAASKARRMYNENGYTSDLINSYSWDTAIVFIQNFGSNVTYSRKTSFTKEFKENGTDDDIQCNIYDMASNVREWTTEISTNKLDALDIHNIHRGGSYNISTNYTSNRIDIKTTYNLDEIGFRPILYIK